MPALLAMCLNLGRMPFSSNLLIMSVKRAVWRRPSSSRLSDDGKWVMMPLDFEAVQTPQKGNQTVQLARSEAEPPHARIYLDMPFNGPRAFMRGDPVQQCEITHRDGQVVVDENIQGARHGISPLRTRIGTPIPFSRSSLPSSTVATPK